MKTKWEFKWAKPEEFEKERRKIEKAYDDFVSKWKSRNDYLEKIETLKEILDDYEDLKKNYSGGGKEGYYYHLKEELDESDVSIRSKANSINEFSKKQSNKIMFFTISLGSISKEKQEEFLNNNQLKDYNNFLRRKFENAKHILSEKEEKIISLKSNVSHEMWTRMTSSLLAKETRKVLNEYGKEKEMTYNELMTLMRSQNKELRDNALKAFESIMEKYEEIAEFELNAVLEDAKIEDELRGFQRADEARIKGDLIDKDFIESILSAVKEKFNLSKRYYSLKAKLLGQDKIGYYEKNTKIGNFNKKFSYEESIEIIKKVFSKLDASFLDIFEKMLEEGKIDAFPKKGKNGGAFCAGWRKIDPTYVLLNHTNELRDISVIAHEIGHAINDEMMRKNEISLNYSHPKSTAEVASTFMEDFVFDEVLKELNDEEKFSVMIQKLEDDFSTIHRQISLYFFELEIHEKYRNEGYLSKEKIAEIFEKHMAGYLGENVDMKNINLWWVYWPHIRYYFYVYSYASGLLISKAMQKKYREDNSFIEKIKEFLKTGTSKMPRDTFKKMGIEINKDFFLEGLKEIENLLSQVENLAKKLKKI